jgi:plasmid maintenance system antidote protein VapI
VVRERRGISADTAMRLARYFGGDARWWLNLQSAYDLRVAEIRNAKRIARDSGWSSDLGAHKTEVISIACVDGFQT